MDAIVALGGLLIAALSLWLSYESRRASYRDALYAKQLDACAKIQEAMNLFYSQLNTSLDKWSGPGMNLLNEESRTNITHETSQLFVDYEDVCRECALFLPSFVFDAVLGFRFAYLDIISNYPHGEDSSWGMFSTHLKLESARETVYESLRRVLGVEPLSKEALSIIGKPKIADQQK